jgi:hypothetical protein
MLRYSDVARYCARCERQNLPTQFQKAIGTATERPDEFNAQIAELTSKLKIIDAYHAAKGIGGTSTRSSKKQSRDLVKQTRKSSRRRSGVREGQLSIEILRAMKGRKY